MRDSAMKPSASFGSLADILQCPCHVRFTPESGHARRKNKCPLSANSGLMQCSKLLEEAAGLVQGNSVLRSVSFSRSQTRESPGNCSLANSSGSTAPSGRGRSPQICCCPTSVRSREPSGASEINNFEPGDLWYFSKGHGHSIQCIGDKPCHFILSFDNGAFSEHGTFSITDWIDVTPKDILAANFHLPNDAFDAFPKGETYIQAGPVVPPKRSRRLGRGSRHTNSGCCEIQRQYAISKVALSASLLSTSSQPPRACRAG